MNHKRKRPKSTRAGCLLCKPHKRQGSCVHDRDPFSVRRKKVSGDQQLRDWRCVPIIAAALVLTACAHAPEPRIVYREVKIAVPVPCKGNIPPRSRFADQEVDLRSGIFGLVKAILAGNSEREERLAMAEAALEACGK